jgi:hypothetical protein
LRVTIAEAGTETFTKRAFEEPEVVKQELLLQCCDRSPR